jgi:HlyD family secretion protein
MIEAKNDRARNSVVIRRRPNTAKRVLLILVGLMVVIAAGVFGFSRFMPGGSGGSNPSSGVFTVRRGDLTISVTEGGDIKAVKSEIIRSKVEGRPSIVNIIPEGTYIKPEDVNNVVLVELDSSNITEQLPQRQIDLSAAEASATEAKEAYDIQVKQNESDITAAELKEKFAMMDLQKYIGDAVAKKLVEKLNSDPNSEIDMSVLLEDVNDPNSGSEASQKLRELTGAITLSQENLEKAAYTLKWTEELFKKEYVAETELKEHRLQKTRCGIEMEKARIALRLFELYEFPKQVQQLLSDCHEAGLELERTKARARSQLAQAEAKRSGAEATLLQQQERLRKLQEQLEACTIKAPAPGQVVYWSSTERWSRIKIEQGAEIYEGARIISIPDTSEMKVEIKVHETWIDNIEPGQKAEITIAAFPDRVFTGQVLTKAPLADQSNFWESDVKRYVTDVSIDGTHDFLKTGMTGKVTVIIDKLEDVLHVPIQSVVTLDKKKVCYVMTGKGSEKREVETGLFNDDFVEIKSGLTEGEKVLLNPPRWTESETAEDQTETGSEPAEDQAEAGSEPAEDQVETGSEPVKDQDEPEPEPTTEQEKQTASDDPRSD